MKSSKAWDVELTTDTEQCERCRFWIQPKFLDCTVIPEVRHCQKRCPVTDDNGRTIFPFTEAFDWCGDFERRPVEDGDLDELFDFIAGLGKFSGLGEGMTTYPNGNDYQRQRHDACCELERLGKVFRSADFPKFAYWQPRRDK